MSDPDIFVPLTQIWTTFSSTGKEKCRKIFYSGVDSKFISNWPTMVVQLVTTFTHNLECVGLNTQPVTTQIPNSDRKGRFHLRSHFSNKTLGTLLIVSWDTSAWVQILYSYLEIYTQNPCMIGDLACPSNVYTYVITMLCFIK